MIKEQFGIITDFDHKRGNGIILGDDDQAYWFSYVDIVDGESGAVGQRVSFEREVIGDEEILAAKRIIIEETKLVS